VNVTSAARLAFRLPAVSPPVCSVVLRGHQDIQVSTNLDTVIVNSDERQVILIWRGYAAAAGGPHDVTAIDVHAPD
jgi:hypothetical protein